MLAVQFWRNQLSFFLDSFGHSHRSKYDYELVRSFFSKYTDFDLAYQSRIIFDIARLSKDRQDLLHRYYRKIQKSSSHPLLPLVDVNTDLPWKQIRPIPPFS
jgi:hypothetical protein